MDKNHLAYGFWTLLIAGFLAGGYYMAMRWVPSAAFFSTSPPEEETYASVAELVGELGETAFEEGDAFSPYSIGQFQPDTLENSGADFQTVAEAEPASDPFASLESAGEGGAVPALPAAEGATPPAAAREVVTEDRDPGLTRFFQRLARAGKDKSQIRIAHFGDSMIEGDLITSALREGLQKLFGGKGVGFVPIHSPHPGFRKTIGHRFSPDWERYVIMGSRNPLNAFGISGEYFLTQPASPLPWVKYEGVDYVSGTSLFPEARLFYGKVPPTQRSGEGPGAFVQVDTGFDQDTLALRGTGLVNQVSLIRLPASTLTLHFSVPTKMPLFGVDIASSTGVIVDNFPSRGNTGTQLNRINPRVISEFHAALDYDLVILQFGLNLVKSDRIDYTRYKRKMEEVIRTLQNALPGVDILLVGVTDKGSNINGEMVTDPSIPHILKTQKELAASMNLPFLDIFSAMGGEGTMIRWAEATPPMANKDYAHVNEAGGAILGGLIKDYLLEHFQQFQDRAAAAR